MPAKPTFEEYVAVCLEAMGHGGAYEQAEAQYQLNMRAALSSIQDNLQFVSVVSHLKGLDASYLNGAGGLLFSKISSDIEIYPVSKPFASVIDKLYRHNVVYNKNYPNPPRDGFWHPNEYYRYIDDIIRAKIVCRYMDGPPFICNSLDVLCESQGITHDHRALGTDAGYYGWHFYFQAPLDFLTPNGVETVGIWIEIQFSTQLAEAISDLTHGLYEHRRRDGGERRDNLWKWDATSQQFRSTFLGHTLHLLEGLIQNFRDDVIRSAAANRVRGEGSDRPSQITPPETVSDDKN